MAGLEIFLRGGSRGLKPILHGSCTLHWHRARFVRATPICIRPIHFIFIFDFSSSFFVNNMKRTHQVWSLNAMLTPCLANHARTDLKTSCHGCGHGFKAGYILSPRSQLWSIAKPREGSGSGTTFQSCQAKNLCCRKRVMGALFGIRSASFPSKAVVRH